MKIQISNSFLVLLAILLWMDTDHVLPYFLLAAAVHECGHFLAVYCCKGSISSFSVGLAGAQIRYRLPHPSLAADILISCNGCICGALLALLAYLFHEELLCGANTLLTLFNLMPVPPLDGGVALIKAFGRNHFTEAVSCFFCALLLGIGTLFAIRYRGYSLIVISLFLLLNLQTGLHKPSFHDRI